MNIQTRSEGENCRQPKKRRSAGRILIRFLDDIVDFITLCIVILILCFGFYSLWDSRDVYAASDAVHYQEYKPTADHSISFEKLQKMNPDIFAWLCIYGTKIDYPLVRYTDNVKYLNTDAFGQYNLGGALFLDCENKPDFSDFNSIIYGHHMDKGEMFGQLTDFDNKSFFDQHLYGSLWYDGKEHGLEIFAFISADAYDEGLYQVAVQGEEKMQQYLDHLKSKAKWQSSIDVSIKDKIVLLSTCSSYETNGRAILAGKITDQARETTDRTLPRRTE